MHQRKLKITNIQTPRGNDRYEVNEKCFSDGFGRFWRELEEFCGFANEAKACFEALHRAYVLSKPFSVNPTNLYREKKDDGTTCTQADCACQFLIASEILKQFPNDSVFGEESIESMSPTMASIVNGLLPDDFDRGPILQKTVKHLGNEEERVWVIDPIDGTSGFMNRGHYVHAICLMCGTTPTFSAMLWPLHTAELTGVPIKGPAFFMAAKGIGAFAVSLRKRVIKLKRCNNPVQAFTYPRSQVKQFAPMIEAMGSSDDSICITSMAKGIILGCGGATVYVRIAQEDPEHVWDIAPFELFLEELAIHRSYSTGESFGYTTEGRLTKPLTLVFTSKDQNYHRLVCQFSFQLQNKPHCGIIKRK